MKRLLDVVLVVAFAPVWVPLWALTALLVRMVEGRPVTFRQRRVGYREREFELVKFRTMREGAGSDAERLTPLGRRLRAASLDELPQLWQVLSGRLSLVGPRPLPVRYLSRYTAEERLRHTVRPGLTGLAQVSGRNGLDWDAKLRLDVEYVRRRNLLLDLKILVRTVAAVLGRRGVDHGGGETMPELRPASAIGAPAPKPPVTRFDVVYACDDNYAALTAISAVSLLLKTAGVRVTLLGYRLKPESVELVRSRVLRFGGEFRHFDVSELVGELSRRGLCPYTSYAAYSRLFIERLFAGEEGRVVYLDCDTLVLAPLNELFALPLGGRPFAFGYDAIAPYYRRFVGLRREQPYFNSGVMLADLAAWRSSGAAARLERELKSPSGPNPLGDQDLIVRAWNDLIVPLAPKWNFLSQYFLFDYAGMRRLVGRDAPWATAAEYAEARAAPAIAHFSGHTLGRPWFTGSRHPLRARYLEVAALADLATAAEQPGAMRFPYRVQYCLHRLLPQRLFNRVAKWMYEYNLRRMYPEG